MLVGAYRSSSPHGGSVLSFFEGGRVLLVVGVNLPEKFNFAKRLLFIG